MVMLFSGRGFVVPVVWMGSFVPAIIALDMEAVTAGVCSNIITGAVCTKLGMHWRQQEIKKAEKQGVPPEHKRHSFFFIPMRYIWIPAVLWSIMAFIQAYNMGVLHW